MNVNRHSPTYIAAAAAVLLATSCTAKSARTAPATPSSPPPAATASAPAQTGSGGATRGGGGGGGGGGGRAPVPTLPRDWPAAVPLPAGTLAGSTGAAPRWSVLLFVGEGAARVQQSTTEFYLSHGFTVDQPGSAHQGRYRITFVAENRDHSATATNLAIGVTRG